MRHGLGQHPRSLCSHLFRPCQNLWTLFCELFIPTPGYTTFYRPLYLFYFLRLTPGPSRPTTLLSVTSDVTIYTTGSTRSTSSTDELFLVSCCLNRFVHRHPLRTVGLPRRPRSRDPIFVRVTRRNILPLVTPIPSHSIPLLSFLLFYFLFPLVLRLSVYQTGTVGDVPVTTNTVHFTLGDTPKSRHLLPRLKGLFLEKQYNS